MYMLYILLWKQDIRKDCHILNMVEALLFIFSKII